MIKAKVTMGNKKRNPSATIALEDINTYPIRTSEVQLPVDEREMLEDPDWISEDVADVIVGKRREAEGTIDPQDYLKSHGYGVKR